MAGPYGYMQLYPESVTAVTATPSIQLGTRRLDGGNEYVYVYNAGTTAYMGCGVIQSLMSAFSVTIGGTALSGAVCFGVVANQDMTSSNYGWLLVRGAGPVQLSTDSTCESSDNVAFGESLYLMGNGGFGAITTGATGSTLSLGGRNVGTCLSETISTAGSGRAYWRCKG